MPPVPLNASVEDVEEVGFLGSSRHIRKSASQEALESTRSTLGGVEVSPEIGKFLDQGLFLQPR